MYHKFIFLRILTCTGDRDAVVATDGGRYDVNVTKRLRQPVYWDQPPNEVRRCSWFSQGELDFCSLPYEESLATKLEVGPLTNKTILHVLE
jgi:hypothetical protein